MLEPDTLHGRNCSRVIVESPEERAETEKTPTVYRISCHLPDYDLSLLIVFRILPILRSVRSLQVPSTCLSLAILSKFFSVAIPIKLLTFVKLSDTQYPSVVPQGGGGPLWTQNHRL